ncbi:hypothetical protein EDD86DRAFT_207765 [Gorgonomyces haynaldii]|nr:hypothetical protein EDD86DRAFT_207765 [Gorgonomyces haynaldii]
MNFRLLELKEPELIANGEYEQLVIDTFSFLKDATNQSLDPLLDEHLNSLAVPAIGAFLLFVQQGWTGPVAFDSKTVMPLVDNKNLLNRLSVDSEECYQLTYQPLLLYIAVHVFVKNRDQFPDYSWWTARVCMLHQKILDQPSNTLYTLIGSIFSGLEAQLPELETNRDIHTRFYLEYGLYYHQYGNEIKSRELFVKAQDASQLQWNVTGQLGKRTKFQTFDVSQLVLEASSHQDNQDDQQVVPENLQLNDDTLLEKIAFVDLDQEKEKQFKGNLKVVDQALLLAFCLNVKNSNPQDGLTTEQMFPYVNRVLENPNNWMVYTMALLLRSRLEANKSRTVERSVLQLQALVDQFGSDESHVKDRMYHIFSIDIPSKWDLEKELGERFVSLGVVRSALEIFTRLEMWENVISCYQMMEEGKKAEQVILDCLKDGETPKMLCLLGDVRQDPSLYIKAWELSKNRYARAMRSLGSYYFKQEDWKGCIESYKKALAINPLFENSWFVQGCAALQVEDYDVAANAFARVTTISPDNAEAWNNLASVYIKQKKLVEAFRCLREATKLKFDAANIWENYLFVALDLKNVAESLKALERVFTIRIDKEDVKKYALDEEILDLINTIVMDDIPDNNGVKSSAHAAKLEKFLVLVASKFSSSRFFTICAQFYQFKNDHRQALDYSQKSYRALLHDPRILESEIVFKQLVHVTSGLVESYKILGPLEQENRMGEMEIVCKDYKYQARMAIKSVIGLTKSQYEGHEDYEALVALLQSIKEW